MDDAVLCFMYPVLVYSLIPVVLLLAVLRSWTNRRVIYHYSLGAYVASSGIARKKWRTKVLFLFRFLLLRLLVLLMARFIKTDPRTKIKIEGIDIVVTLDVSGSMQSNDYGASRIDTAKKEAIRFIRKRDNHPIWLVIFGKDAVSRCPLTLDRNMLYQLINELEIGIVNPDGTVLATALLTAVNRLKESKAKSRVVILLTDGEPSPGDIQPNIALDIAKKFGIKVYTVGIGSDEDRYVMHPLYGALLLPKVNKELLQHIAQETGGKFFLAKDPEEMRSIYDTIDALEKTTYETDLFGSYEDLGIPFIGLALLLLIVEILARSLLWFGL